MWVTLLSAVGLISAARMGLTVRRASLMVALTSAADTYGFIQTSSTTGTISLQFCRYLSCRFQQIRIGNRCRLTTSDAVSQLACGPRRPSRADGLWFSLIGCPRLSRNTIHPNEPPVSGPPHTTRNAHRDRPPLRYAPGYPARLTGSAWALSQNARPRFSNA